MEQISSTNTGSLTAQGRELLNRMIADQKTMRGHADHEDVTGEPWAQALVDAVMAPKFKGELWKAV